VVTSGIDGYTTPNDADTNNIFDYQEAGAAPIINTQPVTTTICPGCTGVFTISATNADAYQWQRFNGGSWVDLTNTGIYSGTDTTSLTITNPTPSNHGEQYRVVLDNYTYTCLQTISNTVTLNVRVSSVITNRRITYRVSRN